jgi:hypothetical protein
MLERLGPVRLTDDGSEAWPLYEGAVRRIERETSTIEEPCDRVLEAGEIFGEDVDGHAMELGERLRDLNCRTYNETYVNCAQEDYASEHEEECAPILRRAERMHREFTDDSPNPDVLAESLEPERSTARRAGLALEPTEDEVEPAVLPELNLPTRGR